MNKGNLSHDATQSLLDTIEVDLNFLGVVGIEEKLQDEAYETVQALRIAGIKIWMFTGDRVENSVNVALSTGIKWRDNSIYYITNTANKTEILFRIS